MNIVDRQRSTGDILEHDIILVTQEIDINLVALRIRHYSTLCFRYLIIFTHHKAHLLEWNVKISLENSWNPTGVDSYKSILPLTLVLDEAGSSKSRTRCLIHEPYSFISNQNVTILSHKISRVHFPTSLFPLSHLSSNIKLLYLYFLWIINDS